MPRSYIIQSLYVNSIISLTVNNSVQMLCSLCNPLLLWWTPACTAYMFLLIISLLCIRLMCESVIERCFSAGLSAWYLFRLWSGLFHGVFGGNISSSDSICEANLHFFTHKKERLASLRVWSLSSVDDGPHRVYRLTVSVLKVPVEAVWGFNKNTLTYQSQCVVTPMPAAPLYTWTMTYI